MMISAIGFYKYIYSISLGYGFSIAGIGVAVLVLFWDSLDAATVDCEMRRLWEELREY
ncbi:MAG: hypothetical protein NC416_19800 [Eubacterium sp.]|nr:hypothetical protein [Eubacterium sp.]